MLTSSLCTICNVDEEAIVLCFTTNENKNDNFTKVIDIHHTITVGIFRWHILFLFY